ncbi:MAG: sulfotransferase, partial [Pseudomonadota bacterium]
MKVVHIGMGKTATSSLQATAFPLMKTLGVVAHYNPPDVMAAINGAVNGRAPARDVAALFSPLPDVFVSNETIVEWDPAFWESAADRALAMFGPETVIIITMRDPDTYLRSLYQQLFHSGKVQSPEHVFLNAKAYRAVQRFVRPSELDVVDIDGFDLETLAALYAERFSKVVLVPFEAVGEMGFAAHIWNAQEDIIGKLREAFLQAPASNPSYSRLAMALTLGRERVLRQLGLRSRSSSDAQFEATLSLMSGKEAKRGGTFSILPSWSRLMHLLSRYGPQTRYQLPQRANIGPLG